MKLKIRIYSLMVLITVLCITCVKTYNPSVIQAPNSYLVVDGFINATGVTAINLSRSRNLSDTVLNIPELNAKLSIVNTGGTSYTLTDANQSGNYLSSSLNLNAADKYALKITTADGHQYLSDFVPVNISAPIDSLSWRQDSSLTVYLTSHDPTNKSIYYKWDFTETWEHYSLVQTYWIQKDGIIYYADPTNQTDSCWTTLNSSYIITGTSVALSQDVISKQPITTIPQNDPRGSVRYSILVTQTPLTADAYNYWELIKKNSQQLGTLFDPEPSQLNGNVHSTTNPEEPVLGYVSAVAPQQKRLFISHSELTDWASIHQSSCPAITIPTDPSNPFLYTYPDTDYAPWYFTGSSPNLGLLVVKKVCVDCREMGGENKRPLFW